MTTPKTYKGLPLDAWIRDGFLLFSLSDTEMIELYALIYSTIIDDVEPYVKRSKMIEANLIIDRIKSNL